MSAAKEKVYRGTISALQKPYRPTKYLDSRDREELWNCPMLRSRNDGAGPRVWERSRSGFYMQYGSRLADSLVGLSRAPGASGPRGSSAHNRPASAADAAR